MNQCDDRNTLLSWRVELRPREFFVSVKTTTRSVGGSSWFGVVLGRLAG